MDKQGASSGTQTEEKGPWNVERGTGHLGGVQECCQSIPVCSMRKAKVHLELNLARDVKDNNKGFFKYTSSKLREDQG